MKKLLSLSLLTLMQFAANAQCAMCTKTAQGLGEDAAGDMNSAIIYLAMIPFTMLCGVLYYIYWSRKANS